MDYSSLDFQITRSSEVSSYIYRASVLEDGNVVATNDFELEQDVKLFQMLKSIEKKVTENPNESEKQKAKIWELEEREEPHIEFGKMLYSRVFSGRLGKYFNGIMKKAQKDGCGLRLSLRFDEKIPEIAALPWEYLHDNEDFLITRRSILISRLPAGVQKKKLEPLDSVLRMLVIISGPDDPRISPLNTEKEQEIILEAMDKLAREQKIKVDFTEDATFENIEGYLNERDYHIVHFTGHGINIDGKGYLVFETEDQKARLIGNKALSDLFSERGIRLVVLSSCESAKGSNKEAFSDLASMLSKRGIPAVVAMQYSVLDDVATKFAYNFYKTIVSGKPVDLALREARMVMKNSEKGNEFDFATPILYLSDCNCVHIGNLKPEPSEFVFKPMMLPDLQVMEKGFVARRKELRRLEEGFKSDVKRAAIIHGFGGIGKTVLATRLALKMGYYFEGTLGIKCTSTTRPEDILNKLNSFLLMKGKTELNQILNQQVPLEVKTTLLINILNQIRFLVIFDNFEDCLNEDNDIENPELKAFIQHLLNNTTRSTKFIITTRYDFDPLDGKLASGIEHNPLPELHFPQTIWLMNNYTELAGLTIQKKKKIYDVIGGHPWTIGQFAKLASVQGVDSLMLDLKDLKKELIEFTLLEKFFSKLAADAKKLLLCASIYEEVVPVEALSWIVGDEGDESPSIGEPLKKLIQWGLISIEIESDQTVYAEHKIVNDFAKDKLKEEGFDMEKLLLRAAKYYENLGAATENVWDYLKARNYYYKAEDWDNANIMVEIISNSLFRWGYIQLTMDLLHESINTTSGDAKINAEYNQATVFLLLGDLNTAFHKFDQIKIKYTNGKNKKGEARTLLRLGLIHRYQGNYNEAVKMYNQALKINEDLGDKSGIAYALYALADVYEDQGNYEESIKKYNHSLEINRELGDEREIAYSLHQLANVYQDQGNYIEATKLCNQSLKFAQELGDKKAIGESFHQLGVLYYHQGNYDEAVKLYNLSLEINTEIGDKREIACTLHQLGVLYQNQGDYVEAMNMYDQSLKIAQDLGDKSSIVKYLHQLGKFYQEIGESKSNLALWAQKLMGIHQDEGNYEDAVRLCNKSLELEQEMGTKRSVASTLNQLGDIHQDQGDYEEAIKKYNRCIKIYKELGDKNGIVFTLCKLGFTCQSQKNYVNAVKSYNKCIEMLAEQRNETGTFFVMQQIVNIYTEQENYSDAIQICYRCIKIFEELGDKNAINNTLLQIGDIYYKQRNYEEAKNFYNKVLKKYKKSGNQEGIANTLLKLGDISFEQANRRKR